ncbi:MAG: tetratricopeptide repeat protein [Sphingobacteriia bacterium]|jgi:tetratricopeptide (TPR) repeat protein
MFRIRPAFCFSVFVLFISLWAPGRLLAQPGAAFAKEGIAAMRAKNYDQAVGKFDQAIQAESSNYRYYVLKSQALVRLKRTPDAIRAYEGATRANPGFADGYKMIGLLYIKQKDYGNAVTSLNKAFDAETDKSKKLGYKLMTAKLLLQLNKYNEALAELNQAKQIQPNDTRIAATEGQIHIKNSNWQAAYDTYGQAEQMARNQQQSGCAIGQFQAGKAVAASKLGREAEFKSTVEALKQSCPKMASYATNMVRASGSGRFLATANGYLKADAYEEAIQWINKAIESGDNKAAVHKFAAVVYYKAGQPSVAIDHFKKSAEATPEPEKRLAIYAQLAKLQFNSQDYSGAIQSIDLITASKPNPGLSFMKAQAQYNLGQYAAAVQTAEAVYAKAETAAPALKAKYQFFIGLASKKAGNTEKARVAFKNAAVGPFKLAATEEMKSMAQ